MRLGEASGRLDAEFNPFTDGYIGEVLQAVAIAWARMKPPKSSEIEDRITRSLVARLKHDPLFRNLPFDITQQYILDNLRADYLGRLDLHVKYRQSQRDYFAFEAKRVHVRTGGVLSTQYPTYVSGEGMGAFIDGPYSKGLPAAGMLGYVMDAETGKAWTGLAARIEAKREELRLHPSSQLAESALKHHVESGLPGTMLGETQHTLVSHVLRLFHLLLPVRPDPAHNHFGKR
jgi:hypothetical protein